MDFTLYIFEILLRDVVLFTVLRCTCFQVYPACCNSSMVIVVTKWCMTRVPICTGTLSPYLLLKTTRNNTSSLYWGKPGIMRLASTYPLYSITVPPVPSICNKPPQVEELLTWILNRTLLLEWRLNTQYPPGPSYPSPLPQNVASLTWPISCTKGLGLWYPGSAIGFSVLTDVPGSPPCGCASQGAVLPSPQS